MVEGSLFVGVTETFLDQAQIEPGALGFINCI